MTEILTESFCERCGTRYTFESAVPGRRRLGGLRVLGRGLKQFVMSDSTSLDEAIASVRSDIEHDATNQLLDAFHKTFRYCMSCRQYTCSNCWNEAESRCQSCAPIEVATLEPFASAGNGAEYLKGLIGPQGERDHAHVAAIDTPTPFAPVSPPAARVESVASAEPTESVESNAAVDSIAPIGLTAPATDPVEDPGEWIGNPEPAVDQPFDDAWSGSPTGSYFDATRSGASASETPIEGAEVGPEVAAEVHARDARSDPTIDPAAEGVAEASIALVAEPSGVAELTLVAESAAAADVEPMSEPLDALQPNRESLPGAAEAPGAAKRDAIDQPVWPTPAITWPIVATGRPAIPPVAVEPPAVKVAPPPAAPVMAPPTPSIAPPPPVEAPPTAITPPPPVEAPPTAITPPPPVEAPPTAITPASPVAATRPPAAAPQWPTSPRWPTNAPGGTPDPAPVDALAALIARKSSDAMWAQSNLPLLQSPAAAAPTAAIKACGNCGTSLSANARFCRRCGTSQS